MENLLINNDFESKTPKKNSNLLHFFLSFCVEIWNYLQQVEFFAQNGPWVFLRLALSFLKTHKKMPVIFDPHGYLDLADLSFSDGQRPQKSDTTVLCQSEVYLNSKAGDSHG